ncbi:MAG: endolytic transglycosylase MltG [Clostridiales Family XIII bacterium]|jgi:UPF0755 protein|nr:endolytic transglycosylase MltG [Clostridiales Family XIII bacterium]
MTKKRKTGKKRRALPVIILSVILLLLAGGGGGAYFIYQTSLKPMDPADSAEISFVVEQGMGTASIAQALEEQDLIRNAFLFKLRSRLTENDGKYKAGIFLLSRSMSADALISTLTSSAADIDDSNVVRFTVPEGYNLRQIMGALTEKGLVDEASFMDEAENGDFDYDFLADIPSGPDRLEGFLYPETYEVFKDAGAHGIIDRMLAQFDKLFQSEYYDKAAEMGLSVRDAVTMASLIERESKTAEERPVMAGVFYNRLKVDMLLQSCASIQYILGEPKEFLTEADTRIESPYNTYLHKGLPPGPICSPRMASIEAALYPDDNDYLFFVVSEKLDGTHNFSADYDKFLKDKAAYQKAVKAAGA